MRNGISDLESELELEFGDINAPDRLGESEDLDEEIDEDEIDEEAAPEDPGLEAVEDAFESVEEDGEAGSDYVERFMELSSQSFESEMELDDSVNRILGEMEREYFWGSLKKLARKGLRGGLGKLAGVAKRVAANHPMFKALQGLTSLARGNLKSSLLQLAKGALAGTPVGGALMSALGTMDFKPGAESQEREAWENFVGVAREAYESLAENLDETTPSWNPAHRQATKALAGALRGVGAGNARGRTRKGRRLIRLRPGQRVTIVCT